MPSPTLAAVQKLRRVKRALSTGELPDVDDVEWLVDGFGRYLADAASGLPLDLALGLSPPPGHATWWQAESLEARDDAIRGLANRFFPDLLVGPQAKEIERLALRYGGCGWRFDRECGDMPERYGGTPNAYLFLAFRAGAMPLKRRQIESILAVGKQRV